MKTLASVLGRFVPPVSARTLARFRVALGCALIAVTLLSPIVPVPRENQRHYSKLDLPIVHTVADSVAACQAVWLASLVFLLLFTVGYRARFSYALFVACFALSAFIALESRSVHDFGLPLVTMLGWLTVP